MRSLRHIGLLVAGMVGASAVASAQVVESAAAPAPAVPVQSRDLVGTWRLTYREDKDNALALVRQLLTVRPDSTGLRTVVWRNGVDTISCTRKFRWSLKDNVLHRSDLPNPNVSRDTVMLRDQQLVIGRGFNTYAGAVETFTRTPIEPVRHYFAPRPANAVTGTLAELLGTWKRVGGSATPQPGTIAVRRTFFPDSTVVETMIKKFDADTLVCTQESQEWGAQKGYDANGYALTQYVVQGQRLSLFSTSDTAHTAPTDIYERMSAPQEP